METLTNLTILIGRENNSNRLMLSVLINGQKKDVFINNTDSSILSVSRCVPEQGIAHCSIVIDSKGEMVLKNLKDQNITYVDGMEISSKTITDKSHIELGCNRYPISVKTIIQSIEKLKPEEFSILPLKQVWEDYHDQILKTKQRQRKLTVIRSSSGIFTTGGVLLMKFGTLPVFSTIASVAGLVVFVLSFIVGIKDKSIEEGEARLDEFQDKYVCPKCGRYLGSQPYKLIRQNKACPYCKAIWNEK